MTDQELHDELVTILSETPCDQECASYLPNRLACIFCLGWALTAAVRKHQAKALRGAANQIQPSSGVFGQSMLNSIAYEHDKQVAVWLRGLATQLTREGS